MSTVLVCPTCSKVWPYSGSADRATCPECKGKVPVDRYAVTDIDDILTTLRGRIEALEDTAEDGRLARDQIEGRRSKTSLKKMLIDLSNEVEELEQRIAELESDDGEIDAFAFDGG